jgi:hypothetical protein
VAVTAVQQIRRMRGGAQSHLMLASDDQLYVVKFRNNPQDVRVLANEMLASRLAFEVGLTVPPCDVIEVSPWLIQNTAELTIERRDGSEPCVPGLQFASRWVGGLMPEQTFDYLPEESLLRVTNLNEFAGMLALDKWTCNVNGRQAVFKKTKGRRAYKATFVDQGYCFHAAEWKFVDVGLAGVFPENTVYREVTGWGSFEPWLSRIEKFPEDKAWKIAETIPPEWYGGDLSSLESLIERLLVRRTRVRELIVTFRESSRKPFPNWGKAGGKGERKGGSGAEVGSTL